jgi:hypothetical protein
MRRLAGAAIAAPRAYQQHCRLDRPRALRDLRAARPGGRVVWLRASGEPAAVDGGALEVTVPIGRPFASRVRIPEIFGKDVDPRYTLGDETSVNRVPGRDSSGGTWRCLGAARRRSPSRAAVSSLAIGGTPTRSARWSGIAPHAARGLG